MEIDVAEIPPLAGFISKERDVETGLDYFGARYYDQRFAAANSWRGQWLSVDPLADISPDQSSYAYADDNPIIGFDVLGLKDTTINGERGFVLPGLTSWGTTAPWYSDEGTSAAAGIEMDRYNARSSFAHSGSDVNQGQVASALWSFVQGLYYTGKDILDEAALAPIAPAADIFEGSEFILNPEWKNWESYMSRRGWTEEEIQQTLKDGKWETWTGKPNYLHPSNAMSKVTNLQTDKSLIIDNITHEIIQLSKQGYRF